MSKKKQPLDLAAYWAEVGSDNMAKVVESIGSTMRYFRLVKNGHKNVSPQRAEQIVDAARLHTPGFEPSFEMMMRPRLKRTPGDEDRRKIAASPAFMKATKRRAGRVTA